MEKKRVREGNDGRRLRGRRSRVRAPSTATETFTDETGREIGEVVMPLPPRAFDANRYPPREELSTAPSRMLDVHTGARTWAAAGDDAPAAEVFDADRTRAVDLFVADHRARLLVQLDLNRAGTQVEAQREDFEQRDASMYRGYNEIRPRTMRNYVPTRRSDAGGERRRRGATPGRDAPRARVGASRSAPRGTSTHRATSAAACARTSRARRPCRRGA